MPTPAPCGSWRSPINAEMVGHSTISLQEIVVDGADVYWVESRPAEAGRYVVVRAAADGTVADVTPPGYSARTLVNAYGGGSFVADGGTVFFSNYAPGAPAPYTASRDQRLYRQDPGRAPIPLTDTLNSAYADAVVDRRRGRLIAVREDRTYALHGQAVASLVAIGTAEPGAQRLLAQGNDFYAAPRLSPDGAQLCWLTWNYPNMPWDGSQLWLADLDDAGDLRNVRQIAGGLTESVVQPEWSPDGALYFLSDRTNWWNLYRYRRGVVEPVYLAAHDFGAAPWTMRTSQYDFIDADRAVVSYVDDGEWRLATLELSRGELTPLDTGLTDISHVRVCAGAVVCFGGAPTRATALLRHDLASGRQAILRSSTTLDWETLAPYVAVPRPVSSPTGEAATAHAFYYPPTSPDFSVPAGERPPLLIKNHGGPTAAASTSLDPAIQYFTSRGIGVLDVNYRGSTGYGRAYRLALYGNWGLYDVEDCRNCATGLIAAGDVDPARVLARGGSAGGFTTLALLAFTDLCRAGASYYGVSNLEMIAQDSDKLEAFYPTKLIGPYPAERATYVERSPYFHADRVQAPVIFFQGLEDPVVPPAQTRVMVESLAKRGMPVAALYFEHEQHGFRIAANIQRSLEAEFAFYAAVLGFTPADPLPSPEIQNWPPRAQPSPEK